jgi:hypothetical protein
VTKKAKILLNKIQEAESELKRLKIEYRKVCHCNTKLPGIEEKPDNNSFYRKLYDTCDYHKVKYYRGVNA